MIGRIPATTRLRLRALAPRDLQLFRALYCNAEPMRHIGRPLPLARSQDYLRATANARHQPCGPWFFVIVVRDTQRVIGMCSVRRATTQATRAEVGIMLLRGARGHGYAAEALGALIDRASETLPITTVWAQYRRANPGTEKLLDALGFLPAPLPKIGRRPRSCVRILRLPRRRSDSTNQKRRI